MTSTYDDIYFQCKFKCTDAPSQELRVLKTMVLQELHLSEGDAIASTKLHFNALQLLAVAVGVDMRSEEISLCGSCHNKASCNT